MRRMNVAAKRRMRVRGDLPEADILRPLNEEEKAALLRQLDVVENIFIKLGDTMKLMKGTRDGIPPTETHK